MVYVRVDSSIPFRIVLLRPWECPYRQACARARATPSFAVLDRFLSFIGLGEVRGGLGLILPLGLSILPWLTPLAAAGLAIIMAGAVWTHVAVNERLQTTVTPFITLLVGLVVVVRWPLLKNLV